MIRMRERRSERAERRPRSVPTGSDLSLWLCACVGGPSLLLGTALWYLTGGFGGTACPQLSSSSVTGPPGFASPALVSGLYGSVDVGSAFEPSVAPELALATAPALERATVAFVSNVLDDVQARWAQHMGEQYQPAQLVLFVGRTRSGCGFREGALGPFYCPEDRRVYIDVRFYEALRRRFGSRSTFAQAYVIAHEIGHHLQMLDGTGARVRQASARERAGVGGLSVRLELQADCYAGVWAYSARARQLLDHAELGAALQVAAAIGDDQLHRGPAHHDTASQAPGDVPSLEWTHGTADQRMRWFKVGYAQGQPEVCDTFGAATL